MDNNNCDKCGKEMADSGEALCPDCGGGVGRKNRKRLWYSAFAVAFLLIAGVVILYGEKGSWDFSWNALIGKPAALVNGEPISRSEARERLNVSRIMLEKEYGKGLFAGEQGRQLLGRLERDVLERMVEERLVAQEAARLKIQVGDDRVRQEIQKIGGEIYGNWENFLASLREDGISQEYLSNHVRNLLLRQEIKRVKSPPQADPDAYFVAWLAKDRQNAKVTFNQSGISPASFAQGPGSCCGTGAAAGAGGGCGTKRDSADLDPELKSKASTAGLDTYRKTHPTENGVEAKVTDYGCHIQVDIEKEGKIVASYSYRDGSVSEI